MKVTGSTLELMNGAQPDQAGSQDGSLSGKTAAFDKVLGALLQQLGEPADTMRGRTPTVGITTLRPEQLPSTPKSGDTLPVDIAERVKSLVLQLQQEEGELPEEQLSTIRRVLADSGETSPVSFDEIVASESGSEASSSSTDPEPASLRPTASKNTGTETPLPETPAKGRESSSGHTVPASTTPTLQQGRDPTLTEGRSAESPTGEGSSQKGNENVSAPGPSAPAEQPQDTEITDTSARSRTSASPHTPGDSTTTENEDTREAAPEPRNTTRTGDSGRTSGRPGQPVRTGHRSSTAGAPAQPASNNSSAPPAEPASTEPKQVSGRPANSSSSTAAESRTAPQHVREPVDGRARGGDRERPSSPSSRSSSGQGSSVSSGRSESEPVPPLKSSHSDPATENRAPTQKTNRPSTSGDTATSHRSGRPSRTPENRSTAGNSSRPEVTDRSEADSTNRSSGRTNAAETKAAARETTNSSGTDQARRTSHPTTAEKNVAEPKISTQNGIKTEKSSNGNGSAAAQDDDQNTGSNHRQNSDNNTVTGRTTKNESTPSPSSTTGDREFSVGEKTMSEREVAETAAASGDSASRTGKGAKQNSAARQSARSGQPFLSAAWRRAIHNGNPRSYRLENGWHVLTMELDEEKSQMTVKTRSSDDKVSVSVGMTDPKLRSLVAANTDRLQAALRTEYEADIDFSLTGDDGQPTGDADTDQSSDRGSARHRLQGTGEQGMDEEPSRRNGRGLYGSFEWIG